MASLDPDDRRRHLAPLTGHQPKHGRIAGDDQTVWPLSELEAGRGRGKYRNAIAFTGKWQMDMPAQHRADVVRLADHLPEVFGIQQHELVKDMNSHRHDLMVHHQRKYPQYLPPHPVAMKNQQLNVKNVVDVNVKPKHVHKHHQLQQLHLYHNPRQYLLFKHLHHV